MRWYLYVDMDAFYASVEQAMDPALKGRPVIVGGKNGRGVVTSASYEARAYGVHSAMPGFQAKKLCPNGIFLPNRRGVYREFSRKMFAILAQYSPVVHAVSIDEGILDLSGTEKLFGPPVATARQILRRIRAELGLPASGGVSSSRVIAKVAATRAKPNGFLHIPSGSEEAFLAPLPVESVPGVGFKTRTELLRRGIRTIGALLQHPDLASRYLDLQDSGRQNRHHDHCVGNETTLDKPVEDIETMGVVLWELVEEIGERLRKEGVYARCITIKIRYTSFKTITRSRTLSIPTCFDREIFEVVRDLLRKNLAPGSMVRLLGVSASGLLRSGWQESMFDFSRRRSLEKLYQGMDRLRAKYGEAAVIVGASPRRRR
jgi:DNA polymerase-4